MQPTRILPDLQASLICEDVRQEVTGHLILLGVIGVIRVTQLPVTAFRLCIFNRWTAGVGDFTQNVRMLAPDGTTVVRQGQMRFALADPAHHTVNVTQLGPVEFNAPGHYYLEVLVDDVMKVRYTLPVVLLPPPPGAPPPPPPAAARPPTDTISP